MQASNTLKSLYDNMQKNDIEPLKSDVNKAKGAIKVLGLLGTLITIIMGLIKLFKH